jgi:hypothetical protein
VRSESGDNTYESRVGIYNTQIDMDAVIIVEATLMILKEIK